MSSSHGHKPDLKFEELSIIEKLLAHSSIANYEILHAAMTVAFFYGVMGGLIGVWAGYFLIALALGFLFPWVICKYCFPYVHPITPFAVHRLYDAVGIFSATVTYFIFT